ncbi:MAG TPA: PPC domain-containing DNA-binding protein [Candidatus Methylacidiphilales bacterium]
MPEYLAPGPVKERGLAPRLQLKLLSGTSDRRAYVLAFGKGDEVASGLAEFAENQKLHSSHFAGIGAFADAKLAWFDRERKAYRVIAVPEPTEVVSLLGNVAHEKGKPIVHVHCALARKDGSMVGGHLLEARVFPTLEIHLTEEPVLVEKVHDPETGLELLSLPQEGAGKG